MDYVKKHLNVGKLIGQGAFGQVFITSPPQQQQQQPPTTPQTPHQQHNNQDGSPQRFALKCVYPILRSERLANELRQLRDLGGGSNVVKLHAVHLNKGALYIVTELIEHDKFVDIVPELDYDEIRTYMENLLIALKHVHAHNIMHRDIKPANFLFNRKDKKFLLVDFGLAQQVGIKQTSAFNRTQNILNNRMSTPNVPTKRQLPVTSSLKKVCRKTSDDKTEALPFQMLKKLRVSTEEKCETKEPVRLTVGAYESPVTHGDRNHIFSTPTNPTKRLQYEKCECMRKPRICSTCLSRRESSAPKSGTPGYKAPEILLRYPYQTTAIDIWSAGVIFVSLLAGHSPFFHDVEDTVSLAEITSILGSQKVIQAASALNIRLTIEPKQKPVDLVQVCKAIRTRNNKSWFKEPDLAFDLLHKMLEPNPTKRITASDALNHRFIRESFSEKVVEESSLSESFNQ